MAAPIARQPPHSQALRSQPPLRPIYDDDDLQPRPKPMPAPSTYANPLDFSDPLLCVTPEKPPRGYGNNNSYTNANKSLDSSKGSQRVRFDSTVEVKTMSPHETSTETSNTATSGSLTDNSDDTMELLAQADAYVSPYANLSNYSSSSSDSKTSSDSQGSNVTVSTCESEDVDFVDVLADDIHLRDNHIYGRKLAKHKKSCVVRTSVWGEDGMGDNVLAKPEFNSTLVLQKQLEGLKVEEVDLEREVEQKLAASEPLRTKVNEKVNTLILFFNASKNSF